MLMKEKITKGDSVASQSTEGVGDEDGPPRIPEAPLALTLTVLLLPS